MKTNIRSNPLLRVLAVAAIFAIGTGESTHAQMREWISTSSTSWNTSSNWSPADIPDTSAEWARFGTAISADTTVGIAGTALTLGGIEVLNTPSSVTSLKIGASGTASTTLNLTLMGATLNGVANTILRNQSGAQVDIRPTNTGASNVMQVTLGNAVNNIINIGSVGYIGIGTAIAGTGRNVTKTGTGSGVLTFYGSTHNTYSGVTTVAGGVLELRKTNSSSTVNAVSGDITIGDGATTAGLDVLRLAGSGGNQIADTSILTFNGTGSNAGTFRLNGQNETVGGLVSVSEAGVIENSLTSTGSTLTAAVDTTNRTYSGIIRNGGTGALAFTKTGTADQTFSGSVGNTYTGKTTVNTGTLILSKTEGVTAISSTGATGTSAADTDLLVTGGVVRLDASNQIADTAKIGLSGGTLTLNGVSEGTTAPAGAGVGSLTLSANSIINLAGTSVLHFGDSSGQTWTSGATLSIWNYSGEPSTGNGSEQLLFGSTASGLTETQLSMISFYSGAGTGFLGVGGFTSDMDGEIVPVPEPSTWAAGILAVLAVGFSQRQRLRACWLASVYTKHA